MDRQNQQTHLINYRLGNDYLRQAPLVAKPEYLNEKILHLIENGMEVEE
jgi:hypothetical protein